MKFSFFTPKGSRADHEREAQQELESAMSRAQPPTDAERTWVLPLPEMAAPPPRRSARRVANPFAAPSAPRRAPAPVQDEDEYDDVRYDNMRIEEIPFGDEPAPARPAARPGARAPQVDPAPGVRARPKSPAVKKSAAAPRAAVRPKPPAGGAGATRPAAPQKRTPPPRRRPPQP